jgi:Replication-relaxation
VVKRAVSATEAPHPTQTHLSSDVSPGGYGRPVASPPPVRIRIAFASWVEARLTERDWDIVTTVNLVRVASGQQLERLCFASVREGRSRTATRSRVLARLVGWRVLAPVGRRIGGSEKGSTAQVFALDTTGQRLLRQRQLAAGERARVRRPGSPSARSLSHLLAVSELYTTLREQARAENVTIAFKAEPGAHWPNGLGGVLKPDAHVMLARAGVRDHWWVEVDQATESLPTVRGKLSAYLEFQRRGELGPDDLTPWVLLSTVTEQRRDQVAAMVRRLPGADDLVRVVYGSEAARFMLECLRE